MLDLSAVTGELSQLIQAVREDTGVTVLSVALVDDQEFIGPKDTAPLTRRTESKRPGEDTPV